MWRLWAVALTMMLAACTAGEGASGPSPDATRVSAPSGISAASTAAATPEPTPTPSPEPTPVPTPAPTPSASPIAVFHPPPYTVVIDPGHGGPSYWGASARGADGTLYIEKDLALEVSLKLRDLLVANGHNVVMTRDGDYTLTPFDASAYRPSMIADLQARVGVANEAQADLLVSVHFNSWTDSSLSGTQSYCNPDRPYGDLSCQAARFVAQELMVAIRRHGNLISGLGDRNDADVGGDPSNPHSYLLGTNENFNPSLMPGVITEVLFLSSPSDLKLFTKPGATDAIAEGFAEGIRDYFAWLPSN